MACNTCDKNICYEIPLLNQDEDFFELTASTFIQTAQLKDACGNPRINLGCTLKDCSEANPQIQFKYIPDDRVITIKKVKFGDKLNDFEPCDCSALATFQAVDDNNKALFYFITEEYTEDIPATLVECSMVTDTCLDNCVEILSDLCVNGDVFADKVEAQQFFGNGCGITNTDDTQPVSLVYTKGTSYADDTLKLTFENKKVCAGFTPELLSTPELNISDFTHNTVNKELSLTNDTLTVTDSDTNTVNVDLSKYNNSQEQYIEPGHYLPNQNGVVTIPYYNIEPPYTGDEKLIIDFEDAFDNVSLSHVDYNGCTGELSLKNAKGQTYVVPGKLPTNIHLNGEIQLNEKWVGHIYYSIYNQVITVICNFSLKQGQTLNGQFAYLGRLPIKLPDYTHTDDQIVDHYYHKWLTSQIGSSYDRLNRIHLVVKLDGQIWINQWQIPEIIQDSFTMVIEDIDDGLCQ
jgi:hypothetical protein